MGKYFKLQVVYMLLLGGALPIIGSFLLESTIPDWRWDHHPFHAVVEGVGAFAAFIIATLIILLRSSGKLIPTYIWLACGLIGMGVMDGFHAALYAGTTFVWTHSLATFIGGTLFAMVWFSDGISKNRVTYKLPLCVLVITLIIGISSLIFPSFIPSMVIDGKFSSMAQGLNIAGGVGFLASSGYLVFTRHGSASTENTVFSIQAFLFGIAALLFEFSELWDAPWWLWHVLRLMAYMFSAYYFFKLFIGMSQQLKENSNNLEVMVSDRTRQLSEKITELDFQKNALDEHAIVSITDVKGSIIHANEKFCEISGYSLEELLGNNHRMLKSNEHSLVFYTDLWKTIANGKPWHGEIKNNKKDGGYYWVKATIVPFLNEHGKPFQYVAIRTDITERKNTEANALKANQAKSEFLSSMSHELRTPMNAILGFGQMLQFNTKEPLSGTQEKCVEQIIKGGKYLLELINDVLDLAKIEAGKVELSLEEIDPRKIIDECLSLTINMAEIRGISISVPVMTKDIIIKADYTRLKQVILNLLSNAIKYNRDNGKVSITFEATENNSLRLAVTDTGAGIPKGMQDELFMPFSRLNAANSEIEGTGIGLVVCKDLVKLMGGIIGFESEEGKGSTFWFEMPIAISQTSLKDGHRTIEKDKEGGLLKDISGTMLYVEDNPSNLELMEMIVSQIENLFMISAHTAELGIEISRNKQLDIIILDINLPGMSGLDAVKIFKKHHATKNIPVIGLSAAATKSDIEKGIAAGFDQYLTKPIDVLEVTDVIRAALER